MAATPDPSAPADARLGSASVLGFERRVVEALMRPDLPESVRRAVVEHVDLSLRAMPEHLRLGVVGESILLGFSERVGRGFGPADAETLRGRVDAWRTSRIDLIRQYVRLLGSLVLFAEEEYGEAATGIDGTTP